MDNVFFFFNKHDEFVYKGEINMHVEIFLRVKEDCSFSSVFRDLKSVLMTKKLKRLKTCISEYCEMICFMGVCH